ncbi:DUF1292 domain-containing protein [Clostridium ihumii]|uniref:DUF1292 domain-containing protein n=1 Tax=Clostridium ihumii TaxID=1470356 RepID=UPI00058F1416|nr:DUF1292 domain-containing protein [Clostridium ihumii]
MAEIFKINDAHGNTVEMELIDKLFVDNKEYIIAGPKNANEAYAYRVTHLGSEVQYDSVSKGPEFDKVLKEYNKAM